MARFDVFETAGGRLVVVCQSPLLNHLDVRFVMPLIPMEEAPPPTRRLNPAIDFGGRPYLAFPQWSVGLPRSELRNHVGNLETDGLVLLDALDMLISGI